jgi:SnoaL-like domain
MAHALPTPDPHAADREHLLKIFHEVESSINSQSLERMVQQMDADATVVWANGEVSRGPAEVLAYYDRMVKAKDRIITKYLTSAKLHGHARFLGDGTVAIADGTMEDEYFPVIRGPFRLSAKWTATAARINGEWKIVALHLSANVFNNVLLDEAKRALLYVGGGGLLLGFVAGWAIHWLA